MRGVWPPPLISPLLSHDRLLFKDFVEGMQGSYWFLIMNKNPTSNIAPSYKIVLALKSNPFRQSILVWQPSLNVPTQGPLTHGIWLQHSFDETTGSAAPWPASSLTVDGYDVGGWWYVLPFLSSIL